MRSIPAFAMMLALAAPLATAAGQSPEPMLGHGIGLSERPLGLRGPAAPSATFGSTGSLRPFGARLEYGGVRGGGHGIRLSTMADNAFGSSGGETARSPGQAAGAARTTLAP